MNVKEEILQRTNRGVDVFYFYMPIDFVPKRNFRNPLYDDKRASCNIYLDAKSDCYRMKDFGNDLYSGDMLFITGGEKDVLSLYAHGFHAICFNSETAQIPENIIESLQFRFRHIILLYDTDETGKRESERQAEQLAAVNDQWTR